MRCFRVDEGPVLGITLSMAEGGLCIEVGNRKVPIEKSLSASLLSKKRTILSKLRECLDTGERDGKKFSEGELVQIKSIEEHVETDSLALMFADLDKGLVVQEKGRSPDALVLIETDAGYKGTVSHKSTSFDELIDSRSNKVRREYRAAFPPPGVKIIEEGMTRQGTKCYLLRMIPKASIRIERTGDLPRGVPNVLTVVWKGKGAEGVPPLEVYSPGRHPIR